ncbi:hypothetical protein ACSBR2_025808 [Camellia fascicularis]
MMGIGSLGNVGSSSSSSSSNLSALAPPFTVDRSNPKPNSNPLAHFTESPYVPFNSSFPNWQYSHSSASGTNLYSNIDFGVDSIRTTCVPSAKDYSYLGSNSVNSPTPHMPPLNPNVSSATDSFTFLQYSSGIPSNRVEVEPYYPPFVSTLVEDDNPLVALNEPSYDLLSNSCVAPLDGSFQVDYTQSLSGLEYTPQWGGFWNRLADGEQGEQVEPDGRFCSDGTNFAGSYVYENYMKQGGCTAEDSSKCEDTSAASRRKYVDVLGRENRIASPSTGKLNYKSSSLQDPWFISSESSRTSISGSSMLPESHAQVPSLESATNIWCQKPYCTSYDKFFQPLDSRTNDFISVKKSSPALVIRPPSIGTSSTVPNTVSSEDANSIGNVAAINCKDFGFHYPSNQKEPHLPPSNDKEGCLDTTQPNLHVDRSDCFFVASSSTRKEEPSNKPVTKDVVDHMSEAGMEFQLPNINVPDGFTLPLDSAKCFTVVEDSSESFDHYNAVVDSPCWKGAPASPFSPPEVSEALTPQHLMKELEACNGLKIFPSCTDDTVRVSCENQFEKSVYEYNGYVELGSLICPERLSNANFPAKERSSADAVKAGFNYPQMSSNNVQFSNDIGKPRKEYDVPTDSKSNPDMKSSHTKPPGLDKGEFVSQSEFKLCTGVVDSGLKISDTSENDSVSFHVMESTSCFPCNSEDVNDLAKLHETVLTPKMNAQMLVNTIHNLSELLLFHCSNDASALSEHDHKALKHVINNIDACVSQRMLPMTATRESMLSQQGTSNESRKLPDLRKGVIAGSPPLTKEADASSHGHFDHHGVHNGKRNRTLFSKEVDKFPDFVSLSDDVDNLKNNNTVQAIKEVLKEDFNGCEEMQSETLLYKNLWLEAEAALCFSSYRARFNRMKIEMEKCKSHNTKDVAETSNAVEKLPSSEFAPDPKISQKVTPESEDSPMSDKSIQDSSIPSTTKIVDDDDASTMARFHILKCRGQNSSAVNTEGQQRLRVTSNAAEKLPSFNFSPNPSITHEVTPESKDSPMSEKSIQGSSIPSTTKVVDDIDASAMARFHILKRRGQSLSSVNTDGQRLSETINAVEKIPSSKFSPDPNITRKVTPKTNDSPILSKTKIIDDVDASTMARFDILKCRVQNSNSEWERLAQVVEYGFAGKGNDRQLIGNRSEHGSLEVEVDDVHASTMARFDILKRRGQNSNSVNTEQERLAQVVESKFAGKGNDWRLIGNRSDHGSLEVGDGAHLQYFSDISKLDKFGSFVGGSEHENVQESRVFAMDDQAIQYGWNRLGSELPPGWVDSSSSDWEYVPMDEFAREN